MYGEPAAQINFFRNMGLSHITGMYIIQEYRRPGNSQANQKSGVKFVESAQETQNSRSDAVYSAGFISAMGNYRTTHKIFRTKRLQISRDSDIINIVKDSES